MQLAIARDTLAYQDDKSADRPLAGPGGARLEPRRRAGAQPARRHRSQRPGSRKQSRGERQRAFDPDRRAAGARGSNCSRFGLRARRAHDRGLRAARASAAPPPRRARGEAALVANSARPSRGPGAAAAAGAADRFESAPARRWSQPVRHDHGACRRRQQLIFDGSAAPRRQVDSSEAAAQGSLAAWKQAILGALRGCRKRRGRFARGARTGGDLRERSTLRTNAALLSRSQYRPG